MPRFYLNVEYASFLDEDEDGQEFATPSAALEEALAVAKELLVESIRSNSALVPRRILVRDADHEIGAVQVKDVVPPAIY